MKTLKIFLCLFTTALIAACGFTPIHGKYSARDNMATQDSLAQIRIDNIPDRTGQYLRNALIDRFYTDGRPLRPAYRLHIDRIRERTTDLDITKSSDATRAQLRLRTSLVLYDTTKNRALLKRKLTTVTSYNILQSQFTTRVSEQSARENALGNLADQIETQLSLYFTRSP